MAPCRWRIEGRDPDAARQPIAYRKHDGMSLVELIGRQFSTPFLLSYGGTEGNHMADDGAGGTSPFLVATARRVGREDILAIFSTVSKTAQQDRLPRRKGRLPLMDACERSI
jgi:hypothetical protein